MPYSRTKTYWDTIDEQERSFLLQHANAQRSSYFKTSYLMFLAITVVFALVFTIANFTYNPHHIPPEVTTPLSPKFVLQLTAIFYGIGAVIFLVFYYLAIHSLYQEIKKGKKLIATVKIRQKQYIKQNDTYHLHLHHFLKKSIEVRKDFYELVQVNDEINVEFMPNSERIMGYH